MRKISWFISIIIILTLIVLINMKYANAEITKNGISVNLIENTDFCAEDCHSIYNVCFDAKITTKITDLQFLFSNSRNYNLKTYETILKSQPIITIKSNGSCYNIRIDGRKGLFENIDNVPCFNGICFDKFIWWNGTCSGNQRWKIGTNITDLNIIVSVNGLGEPLRTYNYTDMYVYNCSGALKIGNQSDELNWYNSRIYNGTNKNNITATGIVVFYGLDEATGSYVNDSTQYYATQNGTLTGIWNTTGCKFNSCFQGNGASNKIVLNNLSKYFIGAANFSVETWLQTYRLDEFQDIFICTETGDANLMLRMAIDSTGNLSWISYDGSYIGINPSKYQLYGNGLVHIVGTRWANGSAMLYANGQLVGNGTLITSINGKMKLCSIGYKQSANALYFNGTIDEFYIYNRTLSLTEIQNRYMAYSFLSSIEINGCPTKISIYDNYENNMLTNIGVLCTGDSILYLENQNPPFNYTFGFGYQNCKFNQTNYYSSNLSFNCSIQSGQILNLSLQSRYGINPEQAKQLKLAYLLQSVQGAEIYPTNNTCIDNNTLLHQYVAEVCLDADCSNLSIKQNSIYCPFGCIIETNAYNASCKEPDWLMWIAIIIIITIAIVLVIVVFK